VELGAWLDFQCLAGRGSPVIIPKEAKVTVIATAYVRARLAAIFGLGISANLLRAR